MHLENVLFFIESKSDWQAHLKQTVVVTAFFFFIVDEKLTVGQINYVKKRS